MFVALQMQLVTDIHSDHGEYVCYCSRFHERFFGVGPVQRGNSPGSTWLGPVCHGG
jgi:hypothetical protein